MEIDRTLLKMVLQKKELMLFLVFLIASLSLLGWAFDKLIIASVSLDFIPMAPSSALLFFILSITYIRIKRKPVNKILITSVILLVTLFCIFIIIDYIFNLKWDIENIFFANPDSYGSFAIGRMSPISSLLFFFTCISIIVFDRGNTNSIKYIGGSLSLFTAAVSTVLILGYLFKAPLLYGSQIIPVALTTAICFLFFSITLLRNTELKFWTFNFVKENPTELLLLRTFLPLIIFVIVLQGYLITNFYTNNNNPTLSTAIFILIIVVVTIFITIKASNILSVKLLKAEMELREKESQYRALADSGLALIWRSGTDKLCYYFNEPWYKFTGKSFEQEVGNGWAEGVHPDDFDYCLETYLTAFEKREIFTMEYRLMHVSGQYKWLLDKGTPNYNTKGEFLGYIGHCFDITELKEVESEVKLKNEELKKINSEKDKFFSIIAHDLRGPLSGFLGLTQIIAEDLPNLTMSQIQNFAISMRNSASNLFVLLINLLEWSQIKKGSITFSPVTTQLHSLVSESIVIIAESATTKEIELTIDIPENFEVYADTNMFQTIIRNLVSNAVKFTNKGGKVNLSAKFKDDKEIEISVQDSGVGISRETLNNLFQLDFKSSTKGTEGELSTGLGLLLCKEFVEKHGGEIKVKSEEGKGSTFSFTLPCKSV